MTLGHALYGGCPVTLGFIHGAYGFGATVRLLAAGHSNGWHDYKLLAWVTLVIGGLAGWMLWEDMGDVRRRKMEDRRGSVFEAGVPRNVMLMAWFAFAYRAVEVALTGAALGEVAEISRGGGEPGTVVGTKVLGGPRRSRGVVVLGWDHDRANCASVAGVIYVGGNWLPQNEVLGLAGTRGLHSHSTCVGTRSRPRPAVHGAVG